MWNLDYASNGCKLNGDARIHAIRKHFLALDLPLTSDGPDDEGDRFLLGWTFRDDNEAVVYGTHTFGGKSEESAGKPLLRFRNWLANMCAEADPDGIFFTPRFPVAFPSFAAVLTAFCEEQAIPCRSLPARDVKRYVARDGGALFEAVTDLGYEPHGDKEASAIANMLFAEYRSGEAA